MKRKEKKEERVIRGRKKAKKSRNKSKYFEAYPFIRN